MTTYLSIRLESRTLEQVQSAYAQNSPDALRSEVTFAGLPAVRYTHAWGRIEIFVSYQERLYLVSTDRPENEAVRRIMTSLAFQ
jgi:hypothetical protein